MTPPLPTISDPRSPDTEASVLSLVVPMFNEEPVLDVFFARLRPILEGLPFGCEIVCVNDGSRDRTLDALLRHRAQWPAIKVIDLSRNFGKEAALTAGLAESTGQAVIPIDADLQDPPELIPEMVSKWKAGYDVVLAARASRESDSFLKRKSAEFFYRSFNSISKTPIPYNVGDFRLMDRRVVECILTLPERTRFMKGIFEWVGFTRTTISYTRESRAGGQTTWNYWKLWNFALEGITSFSSLPLRIWTYVGSAIASISLVYMTYLIIKTLVLGIDVPGYASIMVTIMFFGAIQMLSIGILGEYLSRIFIETKGRPLYFIKARHGFAESAVPASPDTVNRRR